jgi:acyl transferase domain-containing protein/acyl carrier protein
MAYTQDYDSAYDSALALVGMAGRFPGAPNIEAFWQNIAAGIKSIRFFSDEELLAAGVDPALLALPNYVKAGAPLKEIDQFDAAFFGYTPREATMMDPQHRLFLECAWEALEHAGYDPSSYRGLIGVFAGSAFSSYLQHNLHPHPDLLETLGQLQIDTGNDRDSLSSTVSYKLNLKGPAVAVQTFCSSSLVAVHMACQSLLNYESDIALAGGVSLQVPHGHGYLYEEGNILSPDGECRTFDAKAQGSVMGSAVGVVTLKRFSDALENGDTIYAIIRGSTINNDGSLRVSYTAPSVDGQASVILGALSYASVPAESISYIETHGTATRLGDAVELAAMRKAFDAHTSKKQFCAIGSVKPNVGHLDRVAGVAGLIKTALALYHKQLPPSLNYEQSSAENDLSQSAFYVNTTLDPWPQGSSPRRAGVSSFGLGGTNAHVILEEAPEPQRITNPDNWHLLLLSAKTENSLAQMELNLADYLSEHAESPLEDVAYTLQAGRSTFRYRSVLLCQKKDTAITALLDSTSDVLLKACVDRRDRSLGFLFSGTNALDEQFLQQICALHRRYNSLRATLEQCCALLPPQLRADLRQALQLSTGPTSQKLPQTASSATFVQTITFSIEYALAQLLIQWSLPPLALLGEGVGEFVAACLAGVLSLEDTLRIIAHHSDTVEAKRALTQRSKLSKPTIPFISSETGTWITNEQATDPLYWADCGNRFSHIPDGISTLLQDSEHILIEIGDGQLLAACINEYTPDSLEYMALTTPTLTAEGEQTQGVATLLNTLGKLWLAGVTLDWSLLYKDESHMRIPLPTYPFEHQRYWVPSLAEERVEQQQLALASTGKKSDSADWFYQPTWQQASVPAAPTSTSPLRWLIFMDECGLAEQIVARLLQAGHTIVRVRIGTQFTRIDATQYLIRPGEHADYQSLLATLVSTQQVPHKVVHCWNVTDNQAEVTSSALFQTRQETGFYSQLALAQELGNQVYNQSVQIFSLSNHALHVASQDSIHPEKATTLGLCKVIPQDNMSLTCRAIDIAWSQNEAQTTLLEQLILDLTGPHADPVVAYRQATRYVQEYTPIHLASDKIRPHYLREHGVYLVTGGFGGIGPVLATYLARTLQARLVMIGRTGLPAREEWSSWLESHPGEDSTARKIRQVQELEIAGSEVLMLQADVADETQMRQVLQLTTARFGQLNGVFHLAGISDEQTFKTVQDIRRQECEIQFQPKIYGLYTLHHILQDQQLDFCLLFSSISAILGGLGLAAYASANAFMDAFAHYANQQGATPWLSVNWDPWLVQTTQNSSLGSTIASFSMTAEEGCEAIAHVLSTHHIAHLVNSTGDLAARIRQWVLLEALRGPEELTPQSPIQALSASAQPTRRLPRGEYEQMLTTVWQEVLGLPQVGLYENFFDLGGNSLNGLQVVARIRKVLQIQLSVVALFEAPTIQAMTDYLLSTLAPLPQEAPETPETRLQQRRNAAHTRQGSADIAILAMTGRFPGAESVEQFWHNLQNGVESITFFDEDELLRAGVDPAIVRDPQYVKARPMLPPKLVEQFDAAFFGYSPREAEILDPQHRLFLECCWEVLEHAGYAPQKYEGRIGVFGGANISTYLHGILQQPDLVESLQEVVNGYQIAISMDKDSLTTAVSYKLHLTGPSLAVQTFCSTSLVAVHLACQSLLNGECDMSLAGGVSVSVPVQRGYHYEPGGMESPDGHCRTFDAQAHGSMFGDGVGVVVLKRLADALDDGDQILAVLKGSAINNDGALKVSYTAPSVIGQAQVVQDALRNAGVPAESISYVEAHGTATELGDPIEVTSLTRAYRTQTDKRQFCAIGSVKTNVGHLDRAAGISGLMKTVLALHHEQIPASLHYHEPNPEIDFAQSPFYVNAQLSSWSRSATPRRAGVNSLGMGGTNVHVIVEEAPLRDASSDARPWQIIQLSARTKTALHATSHRLGTHLRAHPELKLADVAYTLQVGRTLFAHRQVLVCRDGEEAAQALLSDDPRRLLSSQQEQRDRPVAFLFPGVGEQFVGLTKELYDDEPVFRAIVDQCFAQLKTHLGRDLWEVLYEDDPQLSTKQTPQGNHTRNAQSSLNLKAMLKRNSVTPKTPLERLKQTALSQPAVFVIEYALAHLFMQWGIRPQAMLGYSLGEYVAACLAGVFSLEDALKLVAGRAKLIQEMEEGAMIAVALSERSIQSYLDEQVSLAAVNGSSTCVLAGPTDAIEYLEGHLSELGIITQRIETTHAFHSTMLEPVIEPLTRLVQEITFHAPTIPYISNITGTWITDEQASDPNYWAQHMCQTVRFADGLSQILADTQLALLEIGPGQSLSAFAKQHPDCGQQRLSMVIPTLPTVHEQLSDSSTVLTALGKLWLAGVALDTQAFYSAERRQRVLLPAYPFERQRYWIDTSTGNEKTKHSRRTRKGKLADLADWFYLPTWEQAPLLPKASTQENMTQSPWLIFGDDHGISLRLAERLRQDGHMCVCVYAGTHFASENIQSYTIRPGEQDDYKTLCKHLAATQLLPRTVLHTWSFSAIYEQSNGPISFHMQQERGFYSLLFLAQALGAQVYEEPLSMLVISNHMQAVTGLESISPEKATIQAACRVIPQEQPNITCRSIDLNTFNTATPTRHTVDQLLLECTSDTNDGTVAYRHHQRWVQSYKQIRLEAPTNEDLPFREQGVYLITGGLGGVGLLVAEHLAQTVQARLILTGRTGLPARDTWQDWLESHEPTDTTSQKIQHVQAIEALGAEVLVVQADAADMQQMQAAVQLAIEHFGVLHGVIHAAGITSAEGFGLFQDMDRTQCELQFQPKVHGLYALEQAIQNLDLDFCLLFSSISTVLGGLGYLAYAAANTFMDAYTYLHNQSSDLPWLCVNWDTWYKEEHAHAERVTTVAEFIMQPAEALDALQRVLSARQLTHVINSTGDLQARVQQWISTQPTQADAEVQPASAPRATISTDYVAARDEQEQAITEIWQKLLGIEQIGVYDNFFELGGHSLIGTQLISRLRQRFQVNLPLTALFTTPTVAELAAAIKLIILEEIEQLDDAEAEHLSLNSPV